MTKKPAVLASYVISPVVGSNWGAPGSGEFTEYGAWKASSEGLAPAVPTGCGLKIGPLNKSSSKGYAQS